MQHRGNKGVWIRGTVLEPKQEMSAAEYIGALVMVAILTIALVIAASAAYTAIVEAIVVSKIVW